MPTITTTTSGHGPGPDEGGQPLTDAGADTSVLDPSRRWQRAMDAVISREIEELSARPMIGFRIERNIDPDLAVEGSAPDPPATSEER